MNKTKRPILYAISTCPRCIRVKNFLNDIKFDYDLVEIDLIPREERSAIVDRLRKFHPIVSFPVVESEEMVLVGTTIDEIKQVFGV